MNSKEAIIVRQLTSSDLGWFAEPRDRGLVPSKQRALNFNARVVEKILSQHEMSAGEIIFRATCLRPGILNCENRVLKKVGKNWRLGGRKVPGEVFVKVQAGDFFVCTVDRNRHLGPELSWTVILKSVDTHLHASVSTELALRLVDGMAVLEAPVPANLQAVLGTSSPKDAKSIPPVKTNPIPKRSPRKLSVKDRLKQPHLMAEMMKLSLTHSSEAQKDYLDVLEALATSLRDMVEQAGLIRAVTIGHRELWTDVADRPISFIDGGVANVASIGAEPVGIRVGSYTVVPGKADGVRERFRIEKQLVAELFEMTSAQGVYDDLFEDPSKLRDAARFCLEAAGAIGCLSLPAQPHFLFLHGALVNPVSAYADQDFPAFSRRGLEVLLPPQERGRTGKDAKFVSVYLHLLETLRDCRVNVASVVERASNSSLVSRTLLERLKNSDVSPGPSVLENAIRTIQDYRIPDAYLFHAILNEGEYLTPIAVDRNVAHKRPQYSADIIARYPLPLVTFVGLGEFCQPLRAEFFSDPPDGFDTCIRLIVHACRLMPNYAFPAGLDIVDKFAKVPNWMSRPVNSTMAVQLLKRAVDTGNPKIIEAAKRMLCGTKRDWFFRPTFNS